MRFTILALVFVVSGVVIAMEEPTSVEAPPAALLETVQAEDAWKPLFAGDLSEAVDKGQWKVENGELIAARTNQNIWTKKKYGDLAISLEFKTAADTNSGVLLRCGDLNQWIQTTVEVQILQPNLMAKPSHRCGGIFDCVAPASTPLKPVGEWNSMLVIAKGDMIYARLNGVWVIATDLSQWDTAGKNPDGSPNKFRAALKNFPKEGHLGLQDHGQDVRFRNVKVKEL